MTTCTCTSQPHAKNLHTYIHTHTYMHTNPHRWNNIESLRLDFNNLSFLPQNIGVHCPKLRDLNLCNNHLGTLPKSISRLTALTNLLLSNNHLQNVPSALSSCTALVRLSLRANELIEASAIGVSGLFYSFYALYAYYAYYAWLCLK